MEITTEVGAARRSNQLKGVARSSGASLFATLAASVRRAVDDRLRNRLSLYVRVPTANDESKIAPDVPRAIAAVPFSASPRIARSSHCDNERVGCFVARSRCYRLRQPGVFVQDQSRLDQDGPARTGENSNRQNEPGLYLS